MTIANVISLAISGVMMVIGVVTFIFTIASKSRKDGELLASMKVTLDSLASSVQEIKESLKETLKTTNDLDKRVTALENAVEYIKSLVGN